MNSLVFVNTVMAWCLWSLVVVVLIIPYATEHQVMNYSLVLIIGGYIASPLMLWLRYRGTNAR